MGADQAAAAAITEDERFHFEAAGGELRAEPELLEEARAVGRERHRRAHFAQLGGLFIDFGVDAVAAQRDGERQPADARPDDHDAPFALRAHRRSL
jgi:hypothetical protein